MNLGNKILEKKHSCNMCRVTCDLRVYNKPRILRVLIRKIKGPSTSQPTTIYIISIRLINH
jgi:hypothetical protein